VCAGSTVESLRPNLSAGPALSYVPRTLTPLESALPQNVPVTRLESALPKTKDLKSFRIRTYEKGWGEGVLLLTRHAVPECGKRAISLSLLNPAECGAVDSFFASLPHYFVASSLPPYFVTSLRLFLPQVAASSARCHNLSFTRHTSCSAAQTRATPSGG
jgi:hypothetical protein